MIPAILWFRGHVILLMAPTTPARHAEHHRLSSTPHQPPPPGGQERPTCTAVGVSLCAFVMFRCCLRWPGSSSQAEWLLRSLEVWKSQRGSGKVLTPQDLQLNPQGWWWFEGGSVPE